MELNQFYQDRITKFAARAAALKVKYNRFAIVRLVSFIVGVVVIALLASLMPWWVPLFLIPAALVGFSKFVNWHQGIQEEQRHYHALRQLNEREKAAIHHNYSEFNNGAAFIDPLHAYTVDLDIFGDYSFYQYINRTTTSIGAIRLADYLKNGVDLPEILSRQIAIQELSKKTDWRHHFQAKGWNTEDDLSHIKALQDWIAAPPFVLHNSLYRIAPWITTLLFIGGIVTSFIFDNWYILLGCILPAGYILRKTLEEVNKIHRQTSDAEKILAKYAKMIELIEVESFDSQKLRELQALFGPAGSSMQSASSIIRRLSYVISQLNVRYNAFVLLLNIIVLWDLIWVKQLERWKVNYGDQLQDWFEGLKEFEALNSFANLYFNHADFTFPQVHQEARFVGEALGHPLIAAQVRVPNDLHMPTQGHIKLVTGSNMAGKSTFLRTVGLNIVLAMAGAPVCAAALELPIMRVYTSMRTQDALHESTSSFYAELKRLKFIIEEVESREQSKTDVFFLLDEILKGTNSKDRHTGSKALIRQLIKSKGAGIIATHDLELAALEAESNGTVENLCIEVEVKDGKLTFDYKIKPGVSQSFNATQLMKDMGIKI